eukprot:10866216-Karenia_brevis.AAC.1
MSGASSTGIAESVAAQESTARSGNVCFVIQQLLLMTTFLARLQLEWQSLLLSKTKLLAQR